MKVLHRYFRREITQSVVFVLLAFLALFAFLELNGESAVIGKGEYRLQHAFLYVLAGLPQYAYDALPIAALIGTIYALAQLAARSEFTIMRASSMSTWMAGGILFRIGFILAIITFVFGEFIAPVSTQWGQQMKLRMVGTGLSHEFRSGLWTKDVIKSNGVTGTAIGTRFINVGETSADGTLQNLKFYEFDQDFRLKNLITAKRAHFQGQNTWHLSEGVETVFDGDAGKRWTTMDLNVKDLKIVSAKGFKEKNIVSEITPQLMTVLFASDPDRMSSHDLALFSSHLTENRQSSQRYEIAFWKKVTYPLAVFVMMALALPFAYLHVRSGGVSLKIFIGIMMGISFHLLNSLFSTLALLNTWPPLLTAIAPSFLYFMLALLALWRVERT
ncbi:MAG: LPS export ABC transporter permease LptG [Burkholderiales bacterium]|nr:LPS export ABC transporter permease LptG [Burkholderiales bacterium]